MAETNNDDSRYQRSLQALSRIFGVAYSTVRSDWRTKGLPQEEDGTYDIARVGVWLGTMRGGRMMTKTQGKNLYEDQSDAKKAVEVKIKEEELIRRRRENELAAGDYVLRSDAERFFAVFFSRLRDDLSRIPMEMKASFPKKVRSDLVQQLRARLDLVLETLYRQRKKIEELSEYDEAQ